MNLKEIEMKIIIILMVGLMVMQYFTIISIMQLNKSMLMLI